MDDQQVERIARAIYDVDPLPTPWDELLPKYIESYKEMARVVIDALGLTELIQSAKAVGYERAKLDIRGIPCWFDSEKEYGEFDLQPLGPNETSEKGAYMAVREALLVNPYTKDAV